MCPSQVGVLAVIAVIHLCFVGGDTSDHVHVPDVISLSKGSQYTYQYNCTHVHSPPPELCYYYPGLGLPGPIGISALSGAPDFLKNVISRPEQQCHEYDITIASIDNVTVFISGLIFFYAPGGTCDIGNSTGPRPVLLNVTEEAQKCGDLNMTTDSNNSKQEMLSHQPLLHTIKEGQQLNYSCPCGPNVVVCVYNEQLDELQVLTTSLIESVRLEEHYCEGTLAQGPVAIIMGSLDVSETTFFCAENQCALHFSIGARPLALQTAPNNTCASTSESSCNYDDDFIPAVVSLTLIIIIIEPLLVIMAIIIVLWFLRKHEKVTFTPTPTSTPPPHP